MNSRTASMTGGAKYDAEGNLRDWWTAEDAKEFEQRVDCTANEYSGFVSVKDDKGEVKLNGKLTLGENTADNGSPMRSKCLSDLFDRLEVRCTHGRPHVSDDNAFIESWFSVLKGRASFPEYFQDIQQARAYMKSLVEWYNGQHMHSRLDY